MATDTKFIQAALDIQPFEVYHTTAFDRAVIVLDALGLKRKTEEATRKLLWEEWLDVRECWCNRYSARLVQAPPVAPSTCSSLSRSGWPRSTGATTSFLRRSTMSDKNPISPGECCVHFRAKDDHRVLFHVHVPAGSMESIMAAAMTIALVHRIDLNNAYLHTAFAYELPVEALRGYNFLMEEVLHGDSPLNESETPPHGTHLH